MTSKHYLLMAGQCLMFLYGVLMLAAPGHGRVERWFGSLILVGSAMVVIGSFLELRRKAAKS